MSFPKSVEIDGDSYPIENMAVWADVIAQIDKLDKQDRIMLEIPGLEGGHFVVQVSHSSRLSYFDPRSMKDGPTE